MSRAELEFQIRQLCATSYGDGMRLVIQMARDMADKMLEGKMAAVGGAAALNLLATMAEGVLTLRHQTREGDNT